MNRISALVKWFRYRNKGIRVPVTTILFGGRTLVEFQLEKMKSRKEGAHQQLNPMSVEAQSLVMNTLQKILEERGSKDTPCTRSNAIRKEVVYSFEQAVEEVAVGFKRVDYLEIGSFQGASMAIIGLILRQRGILGRLVSVDPYFEEGYYEDAGLVEGPQQLHIVGKSIKEIAQDLYAALDLEVELVQKPSNVALTEMLCKGSRFSLVYIDGNHGGLFPMIDFGFCTTLMEENGVIMLDDHGYPNVKVVKQQCDKHLDRIYEMSKVAVYRWRSPSNR